VSTFQKVFCIACFALLLGPNIAWSQRSSELSADLPNTRTMATQDKVDALFDAGHFKRAFFIYRNELALVGDKYAQYMVGYMYLTGMGVEEDTIRASAWYRLAAERGTLEFVAVRDQLLRKLNDEEMQLSNAEYIELRTKYCDLAVLLASVKRNLSEVGAKTGSRIQGENNSMTVVDPRNGRVQSGAEYYGALRAEMEDRLKLMKEIGGFEGMSTNPEQVNLRELERDVKAHIESFD
jgi:TPR repeat protein